MRGPLTLTCHSFFSKVSRTQAIFRASTRRHQNKPFFARALISIGARCTPAHARRRQYVVDQQTRMGHHMKVSHFRVSHLAIGAAAIMFAGSWQPSALANHLKAKTREFKTREFS